MADYHRVFEVKADPHRAFNAFTDPTELEQWFTTKWEPNDGADGGGAASPGGSVQFELVDAKPGELLQYRQTAGSAEIGIDVTVTFESTETGTRITVTNAGFGGESILTSENVRGGFDEAYADLALYLDYGVAFARHRDLCTDTTFGATTRDTAAGAVVTEIEPSQFASHVGLRSGDLVAQIGRTPIFSTHDIAVVLHEYSPGDDAEVVWIRDGVINRDTERFRPRDMKVFEHIA